MFRTLALSRVAVVAPITALFLVGCGGYDTIIDDADSSDGSHPTLDGSNKDATLDGARADVSSPADARATDADSASLAVDAPAVIDGPSRPDATVDADASVDARADVSVNVDASVDARADVIVDASVDVDAGVDVTPDADAGIFIDAGVDVDAPVSDGPAPLSILGSAETFAVFGGQTVTNTGLTVIDGNLGLSPLSALGGTLPTVLGSIHLNDLVAQKAQGDLTTAYNFLAGKVCETALTGQDLGGLTLAPGVYCFTSSAQLTGKLVLDAKGDPNAVWIFQIGSTLVTANTAEIGVIGGGSACNAYWQVGSSATIGNLTLFSGNIVALASTTVQKNAVVTGRILSRAAGTVTLESNTISIATCPGAPALDAGADADANAVDADARAPDADANAADADGG